MNVTITGFTQAETLREALKTYINKEKQDEIAQELGKIAVKTAKARFASTQYRTHFPHPHDVVVDNFEYYGKGVGRVSARGEDVLFIEFGAGVYNPNHPTDWIPNTSQPIVPHGEYGLGKGKSRSWGFYDDLSPTGVNVTQGNYPAHAMYDSKKAMTRNFKRITKKVIEK